MVSIDDLRADAPRFSMTIERVGEIDSFSICYRKIDQKIERRFKSYESKSADDLAREVLQSLAHLKGTKTPLSSAQIAEVSDSDLNVFAGQVVDNDRLFFGDAKTNGKLAVP